MRCHRGIELVLLRALFLSTLLLATFGCTSTQTVGKYPDVSLIETNLQRGISTRDEITEVLGLPGDPGSFVLPIDFGKPGLQPYLYGRGDVLFYQDIELVYENFQQAGGVFEADMRQRILLVFIRDELFDGFMWYSNAGLLEAKE